MMDLHSSPLLVQAQLAERRREMAALERRTAVSRNHRPFRTALADLLAHVAFHLDRRSVGVVIAQHPHSAGHS